MNFRSTSMTRQILVSALLAGLAATGITRRSGEVFAQEGVPAANRMPQMVGVLNCIGCHGGPNTPAYEEYQKAGQTDFVMLTEFQQWKNKDLHSKAWDNIKPNPTAGADRQGNLAWKMQEALKQNPARGKSYQVQRAPECLTCHSVDRQPGEIKIGEELSERFATNFGVSCEACHGFADKWLGEHFKLEWRSQSPASKQQLGLTDLRDSATRAQNCASCHVGDPSLGRFVTHEIYAAGHPPLPPFELVRFSEDMPKHYHSKNANKTLAAYAKANPDQTWSRFHYRDATVEQPEVRDLLSGLLQAVRSELVSIQTESSKLQLGQTLDYAHFDCAACHHDLRYPSERQQRSSGTPGRPRLKVQLEAATFVLALMPTAVFEGNQEKVIRDLFTDFRRNFDRHVFGKPAELKNLSVQLIQQIDGVQKRLNDVILTKALLSSIKEKLDSEVKQRALNRSGGSDYLEYDLALWFVWADQALNANLVSKNLELANLVRLKIRPSEVQESVESRLDIDLKRQYRFSNKRFFELWPGRNQNLQFKN
jgi:hypothetical protein